MSAPEGDRLFELGFPGPLRDSLVAAVLAGEKTATSSLLAQYDDEPLPRVGERQMMIGSFGEAVAEIAITEVSLIRLGDADDRLAREEGEGFASVTEWRRAHEDFWRREVLPGLVGGFELTDATEIVVERFRVISRTAS